MKFKMCLRPVLFLLFVGIMSLALSGCHPRLRPDTPARAAVAAPANREPCPVPRTGQTRKFMGADDGDLKAGKAWPHQRFTENGDGTVTDGLTGLMWTRNANQENGPADWQQAVSGAGASTDGGFTDWRLPNRRELESLLDLGKFNPALPSAHPFTGVQPSYYWTSSTTASSEDDAWTIHFYIGFVTHDDKAGSHYVWYVRDGYRDEGDEKR